MGTPCSRRSAAPNRLGRSRYAAYACPIAREKLSSSTSATSAAICAIVQSYGDFRRRDNNAERPLSRRTQRVTCDNTSHANCPTEFHEKFEILFLFRHLVTAITLRVVLFPATFSPREITQRITRASRRRKEDKKKMKRIETRYRQIFRRVPIYQRNAVA